MAASVANPRRALKASPRRKSVRPPVAPSPFEPFEPIELTTEADTNEESLVHLFSIDGEKYYVSGSQDVTLALRYARILKNEGQELAMLWLFEEVLTAEACEALENMRRLKPESLAKILVALQQIILGNLDAPKK